MINPFIEQLDLSISEAPSRVWSEYQLLKTLIDSELLSADYSQDTLALFRAHFLVMNGLFQLQQRYLVEGRGFLQISAIHIELRPDAGASDGLPQTDSERALADYYLDWEHFRNTDQAAVDDLLSQFWSRFVQPGKRGEVLQLLELDAAASDADIKLAYRRKAMEHHPDRGGDADALVRLNEAMSQLKLSR